MLAKDKLLCNHTFAKKRGFCTRSGKQSILCSAFHPTNLFCAPSLILEAYSFADLGSPQTLIAIVTNEDR